MASTDAKPIPIRNAAYRAYFPIYDADGDLVTTGTGNDATFSGDGGTAAATTNNPTEIATNSGMYYLDLTQSEMNYDCVIVSATVTNSGAKPTILVLYPQENDDIRVAVTHWVATAVATPTVNGVPEVDATHWNGTAVATPNTAGVPRVDLDMIEGANVSTSSAQLGVNAVNVGGTAQTGRDLGASVLLSSGTGAGQISLSSGLVTLAGVTHTGAVIPTVTTVTTATNLTNERSKYMHGAVWIGAAANTNTVSYVDGIMTNPVSTIAAAKTIADALGLKRFWVQSGVTVTLAADMVGYVFDGHGWTLGTTGGTRSVANSYIGNCRSVTGVYSNAGGGSSFFCDCEFGTVTIAQGNYHHCEFSDTATLSTGQYDFVDCCSIVAGTGTPVFDCASPASAQNISFRRWSGGITINNINSNTIISIDVVSGGTITLNGADGNVQVRGMASSIVDNRTGTPTLSQNAALNRTVLATPTNITAGTITTVSGNVDGSVGSVTGAVGSVTGSVGSVTGAVGSVTGNVGGNVVGSVASVTAGVTLANGAHGGAAATMQLGGAGGLTSNVTGNVSGSVGSVTGAVGSVTGSVGSVTGAVGSVTGNVGGNVTGSVGSVAASGITSSSFQAGAINAAAIATGAIDADSLNADAITAIWAKAMTELTTVPGVTATVIDALNWVFNVSRNKIEQTATTATLRRDDGTTQLAQSTVSDDTTTAIRGEWVP